MNCVNTISSRTFESIAVFTERLQGMVAAVCAEEFGAKPSYMACRTCDYGDLCEVNPRGD